MKNNEGTNRGTDAPSVSVVMPLYNSSAFMSASVESVLDQSYKDIELILIDDCSSDETLTHARHIAERDRRVRVIALPHNGGTGLARNAGINSAQGRYVAFLDSDDLWDRDKLEIQIFQMKREGAAFSYTDFIVIKGGIESLSATPARLNYFDLLKNTVIGCSTVVYDRHLLGLRQFPSIRRNEDMALWLAILRDVEYAYRCGPALTRYVVRSGSVSANKIKAASYTWKVYREIENLPLAYALYCFSRYAIAALGKRLFRKPLTALPLPDPSV